MGCVRAVSWGWSAGDFERVGRGKCGKGGQEEAHYSQPTGVGDGGGEFGVTDPVEGEGY